MRAGLCKIDQVGMKDIYPSCKKGRFCIFLCLKTGIGFYVDSVDSRLAALSQHQGDQSGPCPDVQYAVARFRSGPCTEQNTVGSYFHCTFIMTYGKLFELEKRIWHSNWQLFCAKVIGIELKIVTLARLLYEIELRAIKEYSGTMTKNIWRKIK